MYRLKSVEASMIEICERILQNKPFHKNLKPYTLVEIKNTLNYFEKKEDYEKCLILHSFMQNNFNHGVDYKKELD